MHKDARDRPCTFVVKALRDCIRGQQPQYPESFAPNGHTPPADGKASARQKPDAEHCSEIWTQAVPQACKRLVLCGHE